MPDSLFRVLRWFLVAFAFLFLAKSSLVAADHPSPWTSPHFSIDPKALYSAASEATPPEGADVTVLDQEDTCSFDANGRSTDTGYIVFKVLTQKGVEGWDSISKQWQPWRANRPVIKARVITPDLAVHELDPRTISDAPAREDAAKLYSDQRVVRAPLPAIAPGSVVEAEWVSVFSPYFPGAGTVGYQFFGAFGVPVQHRQVVLDAPLSFPVQFATARLPDIKPKRSEGNGRLKVVFESGPLAAVDKPEPYLPSSMLGLPTLFYSAGTSWQQLADGYAQIVEASLRGAEVKSLVERLTQGKSSREDKEQAILEFLDKGIRYTGIEFGENTLITHSAAETLTRKYGDCKDKALLLVAMLRAAEIPAYMALLDVRGQLGVLPSVALPGIGFFNHAVVYVPDDYFQWIDPTDEYARLGQLPIADQGRLALIVQAGTQAPMLTREDPSQANGLVTLREIHLAEYGPARVVETIQPRGGFESRYRRSYADRQNENTRQSLANYMKAAYLADTLDHWDRSDPSDLSRPFELVLESGKAKRGFTELDSAVAAIRLDSLFSLLPKELQKRDNPEDQTAGGTKPTKKRTADYQLPEAFVTECQYEIVPPSGFKPGPLPQNVKLELGPAHLKEEFFADTYNGHVHAVLRFDIVKRRFTVAEATELRNKVAELEAGEAIRINFQPLGRILQQQGKMRESFQSYRDLIAQHPQEAVHHLQLAQALLGAGMGEAARNEARLAIKLEPNSALAKKTLADILESDLVGRKMRSGSDYVGARAAFREAANLDPEDKRSIANLAILLEYNEDGLRYGPGAQMRDAVAEYRKLTPEQLAGMGLQNNLAYALFFAGEFAESRKNAETLNPQPKALIVACEAVQNGSEAGIAEANKSATGEPELKQRLKAAGEMLVKIRKYSLAADLMQVGATGDDAERTMVMASALRKTRLHEEVQFPNDPKGVLTKALLLVSGPELTPEELTALSSKNARAVLKNTDPEEIKKALLAGRQMRLQAARRGISVDYLLDWMLPLIEPMGEGNDAIGYREKVQMPNKQMTYFVVKEDGEYKFLGTNIDPSAVGLEVLDRVAAHDRDGARVLLDWVRDEQHLSGGDDPVSGLAFPRFWAKGREADARQMKLAAAILVQTKPTVRQGLSILEEAKKTASSDSERTNINVALQGGYSMLDDFENFLAVSSELAKQYPESVSVFSFESYALWGLGRFADAEALAQQRLKRLPDDIDALKALKQNAVAQENYRLAYELGQKLVTAGKADASDLNMLAWLTLFFDRPGGPDVETALKSSQLRPNDFHTLHTLGCLYAEAGKTKEAYDVLIQAMDLENLDEPDSDFWYAFGRIAEQYGEQEIARADYAKVTKPERGLNIPDSSYRLAQIRLTKIPENALSNGPGGHGEGGGFEKSQQSDSKPAVPSNPQAEEQPVPSSAVQRIHIPGAAAEQGKPGEAFGEAQESKPLDSANAKAPSNPSDELRRKGDLDGALLAARQAVQQNPNDAVAHRALGSALRAKGDVDAAIPEYQTALRIDPGNARAHAGLGNALQQKHDLNAAILEYLEALRLAPDDADAHLGLGRALREKGDLEKAVVQFRKAVQLAPDNPNAHHSLGFALLEQHDYAEAASEFQSTLTLDPQHRSAWNNLGRAYLRLGQFDSAVDAFDKQIEVNPREQYAYNNLALALWQQRKYDGAITAFRKQIEVSPDDRYAHANLGRLYAEREQYSDAAVELEKAIAIIPNNAFILASLSRAYLKLGEAGKSKVLDEKLASQNGPSAFTAEGPVILSDTQGVDFGSYLARAAFIVRRNWYALIPEAARQGREGQVSVVFEILKDGSVPQIRLTQSSGNASLDNATSAAIQTSAPFPPLPQEFAGKHLALQLTFLYNQGTGTRMPTKLAEPTSPPNPPAKQQLAPPMTGNGAGPGPGDFAGTGEGVYSVGGDVTAPIPIYKPDPTYSEEAQKAKCQGMVTVLIVVDSQGNVSNAIVVKPLGLGLDEKAIETIKTWKFKPGLRNGTPVPVRIMVNVMFRLVRRSD